MVTQGQQNQVTRDSMSSEPTTQPIIKVKTDNLKVEEGSHESTSKTLGNAWIVGSSTNGIVGTNVGTQGGGQQVVGGTSSRTSRVERVVNNNNNHIERFNFDNHEGSSTTATGWGGGTVSFTTGQVAESSAIYIDHGVCSSAVIVSVEGDVTDLTYKLGTNGVDFTTAVVGTRLSFTGTESALYWQATASDTATLTAIRISYQQSFATNAIVDELGNNIVDESGNNINEIYF